MATPNNRKKRPPDPRHGHETAALVVVPGHGQEPAGDAGDLSAHDLAHGKEGANRLLQQGMLGDQLFGPVAEDVAAHFADDQTEVLQQATDLVLEIAFDLDQLGAAVQERPDLMTRYALDPDLLVPTALHDPG